MVRELVEDKPLRVSSVQEVRKGSVVDGIRTEVESVRAVMTGRVRESTATGMRFMVKGISRRKKKKGVRL